MYREFLIGTGIVIRIMCGKHPESAANLTVRGYKNEEAADEKSFSSVSIDYQRLFY